MMHGFGFGFFLWPLPLVLIGGAALYLLVRSVRAGQRHGERLPRSGSREARVYRLAAEKGGRLSVSQIVVEFDIPAQEAEQLLQGMVDNQRVRMEVDNAGRVSYEFPELLSDTPG